MRLDDASVTAWRERVERAVAALGWTPHQSVARHHAAGTSLALAAPADQLFLATEINEWALCAALRARDPDRWVDLEAALLAAALENATDPQTVIPPVIEETAAQARFRRLAELEARPLLRALLAAAQSRALPYLLDDQDLTLGAGVGGRTLALSALPSLAAVPWNELRDIPTALVTGSNGKTTSVRLLAACAQAHGWRTGYNCTDGVFLDGEALASGDYSGPAGARMVMRDRRTEVAVLETARGGILRRGLAVSRARVALVTNVSSDHFGEYGIDDLAALADAKLSVAAVLVRGADARALLVVNAEDACLRAGVAKLPERLGWCPPLGWFALDGDLPLLREQRAAGGAACGVRAGHLWLALAGCDYDLGSVAAMPLAVGGVASYNVANLAGAALAAAALAIPPATIAAVFARFGARATDNPGRLMRYQLDGVQVLVDYAHNPDGLRGLLTVAEHLRGGTGRLGLLLGHAGNRRDADIEELVRVAAEFRPDLVVVKENEAQLRGRQPGEIPQLIRSTLLQLGWPESALPVRATEAEAARCALAWARPGDVLVLPLHSPAARATVLAVLERGAGDDAAAQNG